MSKTNPRPTTAKQFELYKMKGANAAARELARALSNARKQIRKAIPRKTRLASTCECSEFEQKLDYALREAISSCVAPVQNAFAEFGACDTEPRAVCRAWLIDDMRERHGFSPDYVFETL